METKAAGNEVMWTTHADPARDQRARKERPKHIPFDLAGHAERSHCSIGDRRHLRDPVRPAPFPSQGRRWIQVPAFVASYQSALAVSDIITAVLLLSQFAVLRMPRAAAAVDRVSVHRGSGGRATPSPFPGLFAPTGLLGASSQTTVWLYMIWHGGFPLFVLGLWLAQGQQRRQQDRGGPTGRPIVLAVLGVIVAMVAIAWIVTAQHDLLPVLLRDGRYTTTMIGVVSFVWSLSSPR